MAVSRDEEELLLVLTVKTPKVTEDMQDFVLLIGPTVTISGAPGSSRRPQVWVIT